MLSRECCSWSVVSPRMITGYQVSECSSDVLDREARPSQNVSKGLGLYKIPVPLLKLMIYSTLLLRTE